MYCEPLKLIEMISILNNSGSPLHLLSYAEPTELRCTLNELHCIHPKKYYIPRPPHPLYRSMILPANIKRRKKTRKIRVTMKYNVPPAPSIAASLILPAKLIINCKNPAKNPIWEKSAKVELQNAESHIRILINMCVLYSR
jgi:hypothetical protein